MTGNTENIGQLIENISGTGNTSRIWDINWTGNTRRSWNISGTDNTGGTGNDQTIFLRCFSALLDL